MGILYSCDRCEASSKSYMFSLTAVGWNEPVMICDKCKDELHGWFLAPAGHRPYWFDDLPKPKPILVEL